MSDIDFGVGITGAGEVSGALRQVATALNGLTSNQQQQTGAARQNATANSTATSAIQSFAQQAQQGVQRVQSLSGAVQQLVTMVGSTDRSASMIGSIAGATAQFAGLGSMLGPTGTVAGGLVGLAAGIASVVSEMNDMEAAAARAAAEVRTLATARIAARAEERTSRSLVTGNAGGISEGDLERRAEEARIRAREAEEDIARITTAFHDAATGEAIAVRLTEAQETALAAARDALHAENAIIDGVRREIDAREDVRAEAERMAELQRRESDALASEELAYRDAREATRLLDERHRRERARGGGSASAADTGAFLESTFAAAEADAARREAERLERLGRAFAAFDEIENESAEEAVTRIREELSAHEAAATEAMERSKERNVRAAEGIHEHRRALEELRNEVRDGIADFSSGYVNSLDSVISSYRELQNAAKATGTTLTNTGLLMARGVTATGNQIAETVGGTMVGAFEGAVGAWLDGSKSFVEAAEDMVKGVLKALVTESIVQAVTETARGIADAASYRYDSAALHFAAAAAWAGVGIAAGAAGAAIGAFGGGGGGGAARSEGATSRDMAERDRSRQEGGGTMIVNVFPGGFITRDEVSAGVFDAVNFGARNGRTFDRRVLRR